MPLIALSPVISLGGARLDERWLDWLVDLKVDHQLQVPSRCTLRFHDPGYVLADSGKVELGTSVKVTDPADTSLVLMDGEVTSVGVDQRVGEQPELVVVAHDKSHRLGRATQVKTYLKMTYAEVVRRLAEECGLSVSVDPTTLKADWLLQADTGLGLLSELADRVGYDWWVEGTQLNFKQPSRAAGIGLRLGEDLLAFSARASGHHPSSVRVDGWDREVQQAVSGSAGTVSSGVRARSKLARIATMEAAAFGDATLTTSVLAVHSSAEADELSQALLDRAGATAVTAEGLTPGNGHLALGATASVSDAGPLSGDYPITRVEHTFRPRSGFLTRFFSGDRRPTTLVDALGGAGLRRPRSATGMHPAVNVAQVTNVNDPDNQGRVKVRYPAISEQEESFWARIVGIGGGANRGAVFIPEVNDEVLVAFEGGDPRQPVILGGLYGQRSTIPTPTVEEGKIQQRTFTSRLGHVISLLDGTENEQQAILLQLAGGNSSIRLGKDKCSVNVPSGTPVEIVAGDSSVKIANDGAITLSAPQVTIAGQSKITLTAGEIAINADTRLSLQGTVTAGLKGGQVQVQGEAAVSVTGSIVSIN